MPNTAIKTTDMLLRPEFAPRVLRGEKTQTRRIAKDYTSDGSQAVLDQQEPCPYGQPGDRLRFLTTWSMAKRYDHRKPLDMTDSAKVWTAFDGPKPEWCGKSRPGRFMPLWMREQLPVFELTDVRVERVQEISSGDIIAEGIQYPVTTERTPLLRVSGKCPPMDYMDDPEDVTHESLLQCHFASLWDQINGVGSWASNPFVRALSFRYLASPSEASMTTNQGERT